MGSSTPLPRGELELISVASIFKVQCYKLLKGIKMWSFSVFFRYCDLPIDGAVRLTGPFNIDSATILSVAEASLLGLLGLLSL
jgi:hypothetical protein